VRSGRVTAEPGQLSTDLLGLPPDRYDRLRSTTRTVVHAAALVNLLAGYATHRAANVIGTRELLRLAAGSDIRLHALSTLSVLGPVHPAGRKAGEQDLPAAEGLPAGGYGRSKYVAERLLETGREHGISSVVYRLGEVWPHRWLGVASPDSFAHSVLYACIRTGSVFDTAATTTVTPVDLVARLITAAATGERPVPDGTTHLLWPATLRLRDVFTVLASRRRLDLVGYAEFHRRVGVLARRPDADPRLVRLHLLLPPPDDGPGVAATRFDRLFSSNGDDVEAGCLAGNGDGAPTGRPIDALAGYLRELAVTANVTKSSVSSLTGAIGRRR
jgi:thioester reductase-like protein